MICRRCKVDLPDDAFTPYRLRTNGWCKKCGSVYNQERYKNNPEKISAAVRKRRRDFPEKVRAGDKAKYEKNKEYYIALAKKRHDREKVTNPERFKARYTLQNAVRDGRVQKPSNCSNCGIEGRICGHHPDYAKPLEVIWLCFACHNRLHTGK